MQKEKAIAILGGGVAGLAAGTAARSQGLTFRIFEKAAQSGGNCVTFSYDGFRFDSGAHRLHDRDAKATAQLAGLLAEGLKRVSVPSLIYHQGKFLAFPFKIGDMGAKLGWPFLGRVAGELLLSGLRRPGAASDFAACQRRQYGSTLARLFLLNYSQKLWGLPCERLAVEISGNRLAGLNLGDFLRAAFSHAGFRHLEGPFLYPDNGIGAISRALAEGCGAANIRCNAEISRVLHDGHQVRAVEINGNDIFHCAAALSSIPIDRFLRRFDPLPPAAVIAAASGLRFRQMALVAFLIERETLTDAATIYFPDPGFPFTRVSEPRNRSAQMAPPGKTSLVTEIPYDAGDACESMADARLIDLAASHLTRAGLLTVKDVRGAVVRRLADAYPVLEKGIEDRRREIFAYLRRFVNLKVIGRCGTFRYRHIHDLLPEAAQAVRELETGVACS
jgi:protoporphyrinogen oxidase